MARGIKLGEFCKVYGFNPRTVRNWLMDGDVAGFREGHHWLIDLDALADAHRRNNELSVFDVVQLHKGDLRLEETADDLGCDLQ